MLSRVLNKLYIFCLFLSCIHPLLCQANTLSEYYPELSASAQEEEVYLTSGVESTFQFLEYSVGPIAITICGLAVLLSAILGKYRHAVGFGLVTIVALFVRYFIDLVTSGGGIFFMGICLLLVGILFFFWKAPGGKDEISQLNTLNNKSKHTRTGISLTENAGATQSLSDLGKFTVETGPSRLAQEGYTRGYTGTKL